MDEAGVVATIHARSLESASGTLSDGRKWPVTWIGVESVNGSIVIGTQNCTGTGPSPPKLGRATPTTVISVRFTSTGFPTIDVSPPKTDRQVS